MAVDIDAAQATVRQLYERKQTLSQVMIVDGHGIHIRVQRGHLVIEDGIGQHRRTRRIPRAQRTVRRIVVLASDGAITLDATRWCADLGITLCQIERNGRLLTIAGSTGPDDARLRRAQACIPNQTRLSVARGLLTAKLTGQAHVAHKILDDQDASRRIQHVALELPNAETTEELLEVEAAAASAYFTAWCGRVVVNFASRDVDKVPEHWGRFNSRSSLLDAGRSPRRAADPVNALLNYTYGLAEVECRVALTAVGLDPGLGVLHTDKKNRDSLTFDLLEPLRPYVDELIITQLCGRIFCARDFYETRQGICRLMPTITHELATWLPALAREVAPLAEHLAQPSPTRSTEGQPKPPS